MDWAKSLWFYALVFVGIFLTIISVFQGLRMQDIGRSTAEAATLHVQAENFALDAMDMYLDLVYKHEGIAVIKDSDIPLVEEYVRNKVDLYGQMKGDIDENTLELVDVEVFPGKFSVLPNGIDGDTSPVQEMDELPYYKATLRGDIKRIVRSVADSPIISFKEDIFIRASHIWNTPE